MPNRKPKQYERYFQRSVVEIWGRFGAIDRAILFAVPNGELRDKATAFILSGRSAHNYPSLPGIPEPTDFEALIPHGQGVLPGAPDLVLLCQGGRTILIECKNSGLKGGTKGKLNREQKNFQKCVTILGFDFHVIDTERQFIELLAREDLLRVKFHPETGQLSVPIVPVKRVG
jgi:hypothetical protein